MRWLLIFALLVASPCAAQTVDIYGGEITNSTAQTVPLCQTDPSPVTMTATTVAITSGVLTISFGTSPVGVFSQGAAVLLSGFAHVTNTTSPATTSSQPSRIILAGVNSTSIQVITSAGNLGSTADTGTVTLARWRLGTIGQKWYMCDPFGNRFIDEEAQNTTNNTTGGSLASRYGNSFLTYATEALLPQMQAWGLNAMGAYAFQQDLHPGYRNAALPLDAFGYNTQPIKLPWWQEFRPAGWAMALSHRTLATSSCGSTIDNSQTDAVKNIFGAHPANWNLGFGPGSGVADYFDSKITSLTQALLPATTDTTGVALYEFGCDVYQSPYGDYFIGLIGDDSDELYGFRQGPDFPVATGGAINGYIEAHLGLYTLGMTPIMTAENNTYSFVFTDTLVHNKDTLRANLVTEYGTISALNTAWGSSYTTFDSSGKCVGTQPITCATSASADSVGTGDGTTLTFTPTLTYTPISACSLQVLVAGVPVAGDSANAAACNGTIWGPNATGTLNLSTGALSITFAAGHAPANAAPITATYVSNGYGIGTGLMDEDLRTAHQGYTGNSYDLATAFSGGLVLPATNVLADINTFFQAMAAHYFSMLATQVHAVMPGKLVRVEAAVWGGMSPAPVLKAAGANLDIWDLDESDAQQSKARLDFVNTNYGNRPFMTQVYFTSNADSSLPSCSAYEFNFATQALKGAGYLNRMQGVNNNRNTAGVNGYVGMSSWEWMDSQGCNFGFVSGLTNAYNGVEDVTAPVPCSPPVGMAGITCGGEPGNYGNFIASVTGGNGLWLAGNATPSAPAGPVLKGILIQ